MNPKMATAMPEEIGGDVKKKKKKKKKKTTNTTPAQPR